MCVIDSLPVRYFIYTVVSVSESGKQSGSEKESEEKSVKGSEKEKVY